MLTLGLATVVVSGLVAWLLAMLVRRQAARLGLVQAPNERSSHTGLTPTGGGIGIAVGGSLAGLPMLLPLPLATAVALAAGLAIAALGLLDDRRPVSVRLRLGLQALCVGLMVAAIPLDGFAYATALVWPDTVLFIALVLGGMVWINLFNFMDGIDGLAGVEAAFITLGAAGLVIAHDPVLVAHPLVWWMGGVAAASCGFLLLNWPPARLFMGDTGSTWLGFVMVLFVVLTVAAGWLSLPQWLLLMAAFLADGLATLLRRLWQREPVWQAHRRHAYQRWAARLGRHSSVTLAYLAVDLVLLLPLAALAGLMPALGWPLAIGTLLALMLVAWGLGAGAPLQPSSDRK